MTVNEALREATDAGAVVDAAGASGILAEVDHVVVTAGIEDVLLAVDVADVLAVGEDAVIQSSGLPHLCRASANAERRAGNGSLKRIFHRFARH